MSDGSCFRRSRFRLRKAGLGNLLSHGCNARMRVPFQNALILTGPTGSGKSRLALDLAVRLDAEIIAMDSMTLYRGMDIGTAKPTVEERRRVPHHLIDVLDPWESASVAWWLERVRECCRDIEGRGRRVLFVGGTPLYLKALLHGLFDGPPADLLLRNRLEREAEESGRDACTHALPTSIQRRRTGCIRTICAGSFVPWRCGNRPASRSVSGSSNGTNRCRSMRAMRVCASKCLGRFSMSGLMYGLIG